MRCYITRCDSCNEDNAVFRVPTSADIVVVCLRASLLAGKKRSTNSHETARTKPFPLRVISWIGLPNESQPIKIGNQPEHRSVELVSIAKRECFTMRWSQY